MRYARTGFELEVDLSRGMFERLETDPGKDAQCLGGAGAAARIFAEKAGPEVEPLAAENLLVFSTGLLTATPVPGANRTALCTISPISGHFVASEFEGSFGAELKYAGYDRVTISGKAEGPVYLLIRKDKVELRDASHLTGKSPLETAKAIQQELHDPKIQVAAIGPAGENLSLQATVDHSSTSAPMGVGAVMGSKNLKAIAVRGTGSIQVASALELIGEATPLFQAIYDDLNCGDFFLDPADSDYFERLYGNNPRLSGFWTEEFDERMSVTLETEHVFQQWENYSQEFEEVHETVVDRTRRLRSTGCYNCPKYCHELVHIPGGGKYFLKSFRKLAASLSSDDRLEIDYGLLASIQDSGLDESGVFAAYRSVVEGYEAGKLTTARLPDFPEDAKGRLAYVIQRLAAGDNLGAVTGEPEPTDYADSGLGICPLLSSVRREAGFTPPYNAANLAKVASLASGLDLDADGLAALAESDRRTVEELNAIRSENSRRTKA